jgi:hypothetical protein
MGVFHHPEEVGMEQTLAAVNEVGIEDELTRFIDDFSEKAEIHEPLLFFLEVLVRTHNAAKIADAGGLDPEADGRIGEDGFLSFIVKKNLEQAPVVADRTHGVISPLRG